jgi:hypothetical protein
MTIQAKSYVIVGPPDTESDDNLYWSNDWGWGSFEGCTQFSVKLFYTPLPVGATGIQSLNSIGERETNFYRIALPGEGVPS